MAIRTSYVKATRGDKTSTFAGNVTFSKALTVSGNLNFGDATTDTLTVSGTLVCSAQGVQNPLSVGAWSTPIALTATVSRAALLTGNVAAEPTAGTWVRSAEIRTRIDCAITNSTSYYGARFQLRQNTASAAFEHTDGVFAGAWAYYEASDTDNALTINGGHHYALTANMEIASAHTISSGTIAGIQIKGHVDCDPASATSFAGIIMDKQSGSHDFVNGIEMTDCVSNAILKVADDQTICSDDNQAILVDISATANDGFIKVDVGGAAKYIALYDTKTT